MSDTARLLRAMATGSIYKDLKHDIILKAAADEMERLSDPDFIADLREFLDDQQDAEYFTDSPAPTPNQAVRLLLRLNELFPEEK